MHYLLLLHVISSLILVNTIIQGNQVIGNKLSIHNLPYFLLGAIILFIIMKATFINPFGFFIIGLLVAIVVWFITAGLSSSPYFTITRRVVFSILLSFGWAHFLAFLVYYLVNEDKFNEKLKSGINSP